MSLKLRVEAMAVYLTFRKVCRATPERKKFPK
jgi:hypothetical protein